MPKGQYLAEFEIYVMAAMALLGPEAYGMSICRAIEERSRRTVSIGAIYATLARLERKGFVATRVSAPLPVPGGRARRHARLTPAGERALRHTTTMLGQMIPALAEGRGRQR